MSRTAKIVLGVALIGAVLAAWHWLPVAALVRTVVTSVRDLGAVGVGVYSVVFLLFCLLLVPTLELYLAAGLLYGTLWGTVLVCALGVVAELCTLVLVRTRARSWILERIEKHPRIAALETGIHDHSFSILFLLRLSPMVPFGPLNYALATLEVPLWQRITTNLLGMVPCSLMIVYVGSYLRSVSQLGSTQPPSVWTHVALWGGLATSIAAGVLAAWAAKRALARQHQHA